MNKKLIAETVPIKAFIKLWIAPVFFMTLLLAIHFIFKNSELKEYIQLTPAVFMLEHAIFSILMFLSAYWLLVRLINKAIFFTNAALFKKQSLIKIIVPLFSALFKTLAFLVLFNLLVQYLFK